MTFNDKVTEQRDRNNGLKKTPIMMSGIVKDYMNRDMWDDAGYMAFACADELKAIRDAFENPPSMLDFKVSGQEYYEKLLECKKIADWLTDNIIIRMN